METKPYNLQSPEQIAKDYGGNKQKIAEGMQMGIIDPTAGTLAGMFIDRMRSAAQQEQAPQQSVAQQVFTPPAPPAPPMGGPPAPAGLGATPEAAQMPPMPGMGGPPPGAPPMGGPPPGPEAPPMGMAEGGMVPPYMAGGGLSDLPLPDDMFDEPRDGGYANGGIVAFGPGGVIGTEEEPEEMPEIGTTASRYPRELESLYGHFRDPAKERASIEAQYKPEREYSDQQTQFYKDVLSPESIKKSKQEDMWMALGQIGAKMATTPGSLLQAASAGIGEALPGIRETAKERKAEQRDAIKTLAQQEGLKNKEALDLAQLVRTGTDKFGEFDMDRLNREQRERLGYYQEKMATARTAMSVEGGLEGQRIAGKSRESAYNKNTQIVERQASTMALNAAQKFLAPNAEYMKAAQKGDTAALQKLLKPVYDVFYSQALSRVSQPDTSGFSAEEI